jgi:hypothetical protein
LRFTDRGTNAPTYVNARDDADAGAAAMLAIALEDDADDR